MVGGTTQHTAGADGIEIRPALASDEVGIGTLLAACRLPCSDLSGKLHGFLVAEAAGRLLGVIGLEAVGNAGLLRSLAVVPERRGGGLGGALVDRLVAKARDEGVQELYLLTTTAADWFERRGFDRIARDTAPAAMQSTSEFAILCPSTAVCMRRRIDDAAR